jgi:DNA-binding transcriptional LysR family regulator
MIDSIAQAVFSYGTAFTTLEQNAHVSLIVDNSRNLPAAVRRGELDIAFVVEPSMHGADELLQYTPIGSEPLLSVCREREVPAIQAAIARGTLSPFISYDRSSNTFRLIAQAYARTQVRLRPTFYSTSPSVMLQLVSAGRGAAVLPYLLVQDMLEHGELRSLPVDGTRVIDRPIVYITQRGRDLPSLLLTAANEVGHTLHHLHEQAVQIDK